MAKSDTTYSGVLLVPSWGSHPDDPKEALESGYWGDPSVAKSANFVLHRQSDGGVFLTEQRAKPDEDGMCVVAVLGAGNRVLTAEEHDAIDDLVADLRRDKKLSGRLKLRTAGGLSEQAPNQEEEVMPDEDLPPNRDTTPPEVVVEAQPDPAPDAPVEADEEETPDPDRDGGNAAPSKP